ncbi:MAG: hypothetical protein ACOY93_01995 [Bacillota bacterium]
MNGLSSGRAWQEAALPYARMVGNAAQATASAADHWFWQFPQERLNPPLHLPTLRDRMRRELSRGRFKPILLTEIVEIARVELGLEGGPEVLSATHPGRPVYFLASVWAWRQFRGSPLPDLAGSCRSLGLFLMEAVGGAPAGSGDLRLQRARQLLQGWLGPTDTPPETEAVLEAVLRLYGFR